jgi:hypothetical protein
MLVIFLQYYQFTSFAMSLNEMEEGMRNRLCPTDCRLEHCFGMLTTLFFTEPELLIVFNWIVTLLTQTSSRYPKAGGRWHRWCCCREDPSWRKAKGRTKSTQGEERPQLGTKVYLSIFILPYSKKILSNDVNKFKYSLTKFLLVGSFYSLGEYFEWKTRSDLNSYT